LRQLNLASQIIAGLIVSGILALMGVISQLDISFDAGTLFLLILGGSVGAVLAAVRIGWKARTWGVLVALAFAAAVSWITSDTGMSRAHWWSGDGNTKDALGSRHGQAHGGVSFTPAVVREGFAFDGSRSYVSFGASVGNLGTANFSIEFWIRTTSSELVGLFGKRASCDPWHDFFDMRLQDGRLRIELYQGNSPTSSASILSNGKVNSGNFHHVVVLRSIVPGGSELAVYLDGRRDIGARSEGVANVRNPAALVAGTSACTGQDGTQFFKGDLDEIKIRQS
jgi:Concanavalin A-like lectin/glucanases superfamily